MSLRPCAPRVLLLKRNERRTMHLLQKIARERILILDGAMGSMLQDYRLDEAGYRGARAIF